MTNQLAFDKPSAQVFAHVAEDGLIIAGNVSMSIPREAIMRYARNGDADASAGFYDNKEGKVVRAPKPRP